MVASVQRNNHSQLKAVNLATGGAGGYPFSWNWATRLPSSTAFYCPLNALIAHVFVPPRGERLLARTQDADARQGLVSTTSRAQAVVQNFHLGSNVIPAEMRGCVLASGFSHLPGDDKVSGQQADG